VPLSWVFGASFCLIDIGGFGALVLL